VNDNGGIFKPFMVIAQWSMHCRHSFYSFDNFLSILKDLNYNSFENKISPRVQLILV
jgi:hypothetical protein